MLKKIYEKIFLAYIQKTLNVSNNQNIYLVYLI